MRSWSRPVVVADAEAQAAIADNTGRSQFFFQSSSNEGFIASALEVDRFGAVASDTEQVLGVAFDDPSLPVIFGNDAGWWSDVAAPILKFTSALTGADGSTLLFSFSERFTYAENGEKPPSDDTPWEESWLTSRFFTGYGLEGGEPDVRGLVPYDVFAFLAKGEDLHTDIRELVEVYYPEEDWWNWEQVYSSYGRLTLFEDPSVLAFGSGALLASYGLRHYTSSQIVYQFVDLDAPSAPAPVVLDDTPVGTGIVIDRPADQLGVIWINSASSTGFRVSMVAVDDTGAVVRTSKADIAASDLEGAPTLGAMTVLAADAAADASIVALIENAGRPYVARFDRGLRLEGELSAITGGRWSGSHAEHVSQAKIVHLPDGGFVVGLSLESDLIAGGADHRLIVQHYGADGVEIGRPVKVGADGGWFDLASLGDGRVSLAWTDGGSTWSQILDEATAGRTFTGGATTDTVIGTSQSDTLHGGDGADRLVGGASGDRLQGEGGNDLLIGGSGGDRMNGGAGYDVVRYDSPVTVDMLDRLLNTGDAKGDVLLSIEQLRGSSAADAFYGTDAAETFQGNGGDDVLDGRGGNDILIGGAGTDELTGGAGADQFRFTGSGEGVDLITDFAVGTDRIAIGAAGFGIAAIALHSGVAPSPEGTVGMFLFNSATSLLSFDFDGVGEGAAVAIATLNGVTALTTGDFVLL